MSVAETWAYVNFEFFRIPHCCIIAFILEISKISLGINLYTKLYFINLIIKLLIIYFYPVPYLPITVHF